MTIRNSEYTSGASVAQRAPLYIDTTNDPRAKNQATLNLYASRAGTQVIPLDSLYGKDTSLSFVQDSLTAMSSSGSSVSSGSTGTGSGTVTGLPPVGVPPLAVTALTANYSGDDIVLTFTWDSTNSGNAYFQYFKVELHDPITNTYCYITRQYDISYVNTASTSQTITLKSADLIMSGVTFSTGIDIVGIAVCDVINVGTYTTANVTTAWVSVLNAPVLGTPVNSTDSYSIPITNYTTESAKSAFSGIIFQENTTSLSSQAGIDSTKWVQTAGVFNAPNISAYVPDGSARWVRAEFYQKNGGASGWSNIVQAVPLQFQPTNTNPPAIWASASIAWSNNDIVVSWTNPSSIGSNQSTPTQVQVQLYAWTYNGTSYTQTTKYAYFTHLITGTETSFTITAAQLYGQFGVYYSAYNAIITSLSSQNVISASSITYPSGGTTPVVRSAVSLGTPTLSISNVIDGYIAQFSVGTVASYGAVYQFFIDPTNSTNGFLYANNNLNYPDYMDTGTVSSYTANTITVPSITGEAGNFALSGTIPYIGYQITGTNVQPNTWVTGISGTGPYTLTLNQNLSPATASGTYHMQALVYSGAGPANVNNNYYGTVYVALALYDNYGTRSNNAFKQAKPISASVSLIQNSVQVGNGGAIYVGTSNTTGSRIVLGPSQIAPDRSQYSGIFAFDGNSITATASGTVGSSTLITTSVSGTIAIGHSVYDASTNYLGVVTAISGTSPNLNITVSGSVALSTSQIYSFSPPATTSIVSTATAGNYTFETLNAKIADWAIKPGYIQNDLSASTTQASTATTTVTSQTSASGSLTVTSATGITTGMTVNATGVASGTTVTGISGTVISISTLPTGNSSSATFALATNPTVTAQSSSPASITVSSVTGISVGMTVSGTNIPAATTVTSITGNVVSISAAPTGTVSNVIFSVSPAITAQGYTYPTITVASTTGITTGMVVSGTNVASGTTVTAINGSILTISNSPTGTITSVTFTNYSGNYTGMSGSGTYSFWAGSGVSGGSPLAKFTVTPSGAVTARNISIIGDGSTSTSLMIGGASSSTAPFYVDAGGNMTAKSASITGSITVNGQSYFDSNVNVRNGYIIAGSGGPNSGPAVQIDSTGLKALSTGTTATTKIYSTPVSYSFTRTFSNSTSQVVSANISLWSNTSFFGPSEPAANGAGWLISGGIIQNQNIVLDATQSSIRIYGQNPTSGVQIAYGTGADGTFVIQSGGIGSGNPTFSVTHDGILTASGATILGTLKGGTTPKTGVSDYTNNGYYFAQSGAFIAGGGSSGAYIQYDGANQLTLMTAFTRAQSTEIAYASNSKIILNSSGTQIYGIPVQGNISLVTGTTSYLNLSPLGPYPRQRMLVEDPASGQVKLGLGVYYSDTSVTGNATSPSTGGYIGDLWVFF